MSGFDRFIGNARQVRRLVERLQRERLPHSLVFSGGEGIGKRLLAHMVAKSLNCLDAAAGDFCNSCSACRKIDSGLHPDVIVIGLEDDAAVIKIDQIRPVTQILDFQPLEGRNKVFIIDPADRLNDAAQNAFLKAIEEPPGHTYFMLVTANPQNLLITVRSRCQTFFFAPLPQELLRSAGVADDLVLRWARGSIGWAMATNRKELEEDRRSMLAFVQSALQASGEDLVEILVAAAQMSRAKDEYYSRMGTAAVIIGDLIYVQEGCEALVVNQDWMPELRKLAASVAGDQLLRTAQFLRHIEATQKSYLNKQLLTEVLGLTLSPRMAKILNDNTSASH